MEYDVAVEKITGIEDLHEANEFTSGQESKMGLATAYHLGHSTIRTQLFKVKMYSIPTKTSVHLVRHSAVGQLHFVKTARKDRTMYHDTDVNRLTPVNHMMILNAQHLIDMARKRLCGMSEIQTTHVMQSIKNAVHLVDPALARHMQQECIYRGGFCYEGKNSCGFKPLAKM